MSEVKAKTVKAQLTPEGVLKFPKLNTPDTYKGDTKYKTGLVFDPDREDVKEFIAKLEKIRDDYVAEVKKAYIDQGKTGLAKKVTVRDVFHMETDKAGEDTGNIVFHAAMKAEVKDRQTGQLKAMRPKFFDSRGKKIANPPEIWGGTRAQLGVDIRASVRPADGAIGVTLYLDAVFIRELKTGGGRDASSYGYQGSDDGYAYDGSDDDDDATSPYGYGAADTGDDDSGNDDF